jgi:hypothetical protein
MRPANSWSAKRDSPCPDNVIQHAKIVHKASLLRPAAGWSLQKAVKTVSGGEKDEGN